MKTRRQFLSVFLTCALVACGCGPHVASKAGVPARNATPIEKALAYNAGLAEANKTVAQTVVNASSTAPPLLSIDQANRVLSAQSRIADFDRQLTPLLADSATITANADRIGMLLDEIKLAGDGIIKADLGIKDAKTQANVLGAFNSVYNFADLIVSTLHDAALLK